MPTFDVLRDEGPRLIVCRYEQNAAFMAAAGEPVVNAFRAAMAPRPEACFIAFPRDVQSAATEAGVPPSLPLLPLGAAPADMIRKDAENISKAASSVETALVPWPLSFTLCVLSAT